MSVTAIVLIKKIATGEVQRYACSGFGRGSNYQWALGNYSCDCNRHNLFEQAAGRDVDLDHPCGDDVSYSVDDAEVDGKFIALADFP